MRKLQPRSENSETFDSKSSDSKSRDDLGFVEPYKEVGRMLADWEVSTKTLKEEKETKTVKKTEHYNRYQQIFESIFADLRSLGTKNILICIPIYYHLYKRMNSFSDTEERKSCPEVLTKHNHYESIFARHYIDNLPKIMDKLETTLIEDKEKVPSFFKPTAVGLLQKAKVQVNKNVKILTESCRETLTFN